MQSKEFFINSDGIRLHTKLDRPEGMEKGPLCILIHGFTGNMEEEHFIAVRDVMIDMGVSVLRVAQTIHVEDEIDRFKGKEVRVKLLSGGLPESLVLYPKRTVSGNLGTGRFS